MGRIMRRIGQGARVAAVMLGVAAAPGLAQDTPQAAPPPAVLVAPAALERIAGTATFNGRLRAEQSVDLRARVTGTLEEITFSPGDFVEEGDVLFRIESTPYEAAVQEAEGAVETARAARDLAEIERERQAELVSRDAAPQAQLDRAVAAVGQSSGDLMRLEAALERARINLGYTQVVAPFPGRIGVSNVDVGALVGPEVGALVRLIRLDPIHAEVAVPTALLRNFSEAVAAGAATADAAATLILANGSEYDLAGDVDFIDSQVNAATDTIAMRVRFDNPDGALLNDELVRLVLAQTTPDEVLAIPQSGVQRDLQGAFVLLVGDDNVVEQRRVEVARIAQGRAVIASGLEAGEFVVTEGVNKVRPGITVDAAVAGGG